MTKRILNQLNSTVLVLLAVTLVTLTACNTMARGNTLERNKQLVRRMNTEVWNEANLEAINELYTPDFVLHFLPDGSEARGINGLRDHVREHRAAFPDWTEEIEHIVAEGDLVVIHFVSNGTNEGQWLGKPPTQRTIHINEMSIFRIENDRIAEQWLLPDALSMERQLAEQEMDE